MNANTIKAAVRKTNPTVIITNVQKEKWGLFVVKVKIEKARSTKIGLIMGNFNGGDVQLEKIEWIN